MRCDSAADRFTYLFGRKLKVGEPANGRVCLLKEAYHASGTTYPTRYSLCSYYRAIHAIGKEKSTNIPQTYTNRRTKAPHMWPIYDTINKPEVPRSPIGCFWYFLLFIVFAIVFVEFMNWIF